MEQNKPRWVRLSQHHGTAVLAAVVVSIPTTWAASMIDKSFHWYTILSITIVLALCAIYWAHFVEWLWGLSKARQLKWFFAIWAIVTVVVWLGWPWPKLQKLSEPIGSRQVVITGNWISLNDTEGIVLEKLRDSIKDREILLKTVRQMIFYWGEGLRIRCKGDTAWRIAGWNEDTFEYLGLKGYDDSFNIEDSTGCKVEFPVSAVYLTPWVSKYPREK